MMNIKRYVKFLIITTIFLSNTLYAEMQNEEAFSIIGPIHDIRLDKGEIVINDELFEGASYAEIHPNPIYPGVYVLESLKPGMIIGFRIRNEDMVIKEIWLLE